MPNENELLNEGESQPTEEQKSAAAKKNEKRRKKKPAAAAEKPEAPKESKSKFSKIKQEIERKRKEEEELQKAEEEAERKFQEQLKAQEEEQKRLEELKLKKKENKERLKAEGKLLTEKQKEERRKIQQLMEARQMPVGPAKDGEEKPKKRPVYKNKKRHQKQESKEDQEKQKQEAELKRQEAEKAAESDDSLQDWDKIDLSAEERDEQEEEPEQQSEAQMLANKLTQIESFRVTTEEHLLSEEDKERIIKEAGTKIAIKHHIYERQRNPEILRSGVICVLGHVDTGKTKILDKLRNSNVQNREAGGITQQIGATNVPASNIVQATSFAKEVFDTSTMKLPGLLIIDTPGHESFSNLRVRGSSLCDHAILVVDLMHSLEEQTKESIKILVSRKTPFVVALNKIDRLYEWKTNPNQSVQKTMTEQGEKTLLDFKDRFNQVVADFAVMELNVCLYYDRPSVADKTWINLVPTSAHTGDGIGDLLANICKNLELNLCKKISYTDELFATVMEVKELPGLGTTIDVMVVSGIIREGDTIVLAGQEGPIVTQVRGLLQPEPMTEFRVKSNYNHLKEVKGSQGVKIIAKDLDEALAGLPLYVANDVGEELYYKKEVEAVIDQALKAIACSSLGVFVVASTLGSLESLLCYLKSKDIPYSGISIGTVHKKDVMKASIMLQRDPKWAIILAFDVKVDRDAQRMAQEMNVKIFTSEIIYHLQTQIEEYFEELKRENRIKHRDQAIFPVRLSMLPDMIFNKRAPIIMGVRVEAGLLKVGTPLCVPSKECVHLGKVFSIESNHKPVEQAKPGMEVCIRIDPLESESPKMFGRHFEMGDEIVSKITRESIDVMKLYFRTDLSKDDWRLIVELKKLLAIL